MPRLHEQLPEGGARRSDPSHIRRAKFPRHNGGEGGARVPDTKRESEHNERVERGVRPDRGDNRVREDHPLVPHHLVELLQEVEGDQGGAVGHKQREPVRARQSESVEPVPARAEDQDRERPTVLPLQP